MRKLLLWIALLLFVLPISAQGGDEKAFLRAAHFSSDAPSVNVYVNGELLLEAFDFAQVSDWVELSAGTYSLAVTPTGAEIDEAILAADVAVAAGDWTTVAVIGTLGRATLTTAVATTDLGNIPDGETRISVFHAIPELDPINLFANDTLLTQRLAYPASLPDADGFASTNVVAGEYSIDIRAADDTILLDVGTTVLGAGREYFVAAVGTNTDPQFVLVPSDINALTGEAVDPFADIETGSDTLQARIGHFSVSAGAVDVYINGAVTLENVNFGDVSDYLELNGGIYEVALVPAGGVLEDAAYSGEIALIEDSVTLIAAIGFAENGSLHVVTAEEESAVPASGETRFAYFQAIPSDRLFELQANGTTLAQGVTYPDVFAGAGDGYVSIDVIAGEYMLDVVGDNISLNVGTITAGAGRIYLIVSAGTEANPVSFLVPTDFPQ